MICENHWGKGWGVINFVLHTYKDTFSDYLFTKNTKLGMLFYFLYLLYSIFLHSSLKCIANLLNDKT